MTPPIRTLWTVNVPLSVARQAPGLSNSPFGGWLSTVAVWLANLPGLQLGATIRAPGERRTANANGMFDGPGKYWAILDRYARCELAVGLLLARGAFEASGGGAGEVAAANAHRSELPRA